MIGKTISHYTILEKLGEGGMGIVYKAEDTKLKREVALKFLPRQIAAQPEERERLKQEAQAAAALNHPNIATIYEMDEAKDEIFIAMEYIDGQKLKEKIIASPLPVDTALDIAIQVAEGLKSAHKKGVVHRDIKSANIMLTQEGQAKILDFGLAKMMGRTQLTKSGTILGTVAYMSPEQARGEKVDHRTDIWSFGVMLYEMIAGELPFKGDYEQGVVYSILNEEPKPLMNLRSDVPEELQQVVQKAMQKDTGKRYKDMNGLLTEMLSIKKNLGAKKAEIAEQEKKPVPSIAVLPFVNMSSDPENEYFSDGMTEEIINALSQLKDLRVAARTSSFAFKGRSMDISEVGAKLKVKTVLEGSVRKAGNQIRITAQLVNVTDGYHLWSERYDRKIEDVFAIQDEIAKAIAGRLRVMLVGGEQEPLIKPPTDNVEAYDLYLKGRFFVNQKGEGLLKALVHFQQALALDPQYALAHAGVADAYNFLRDMGHLHPKEAMQKTKQAATRALEIDETIGEAHIALGWVSFSYEFDWPNAEKHFLRALELNPHSAEAHSRYAFYLFHIRGQADESIAEARRGVELDPLSEAQHTWLGIILWYAGRFDEAVTQLRTAVELDPTSWHAHHGLGQAYRLKAMYPEAIAATQRTIDLAGRHPWSLLVLGQIYAATGKMEKVDTIYQELLRRSRHEYVQPMPLAILSAALGRKEEAFEHLDRAYEERDALLSALKSYSGLNPLRADPRFDALLKKMGLE